MNTNTNPSIAICTRIPADMAKGLDKVASLTERSRSFHVKKALEVYLRTNKNITAEIVNAETQAALKELEQRNGKTFDSVEDLFQDLDN